MNSGTSREHRSRSSDYGVTASNGGGRSRRSPWEAGKSEVRSKRMPNHRSPVCGPLPGRVLCSSRWKKVPDLSLVLRSGAEDLGLTISALVAFPKCSTVLLARPTSDRHAWFIAISGRQSSKIQTIAKWRAVFHQGAGIRIERSRAHCAPHRGCRARAQRDHKYIGTDISHGCSPFVC